MLHDQKVVSRMDTNQWPVIFLSFKDVGGECLLKMHGLL